MSQHRRLHFRPGILSASLGAALLLLPGLPAHAQDEGDEEAEDGDEEAEDGDEEAEGEDEEETDAAGGGAEDGGEEDEDPEAEAGTTAISPSSGRGALANDVLGGMDADEEESGEVEDGEEPPAEELDDSAIAAGIAEMTDIYLTMQKRRDPLERIIVDGPRAEIWFLQTMGGNAAEVERTRCQAYRWLFFGRLTRSRGVRDVFQKYVKIQEVRLSLFTIETRIQPDGRRGYRQYRKADPKMEIAISRETALSLDMVKLRQKMAGAGCIPEGERAVDKKWYSTKEDAQEAAK